MTCAKLILTLIFKYTCELQRGEGLAVPEKGTTSWRYLGDGINQIFTLHTFKVALHICLGHSVTLHTLLYTLIVLICIIRT